jgi:hypothetical protein
MAAATNKISEMLSMLGNEITGLLLTRGVGTAVVPPRQSP